jgi:hypothetical protein
MILGFKKQFKPLILDGSKIHTIREDKHNRWKAGNIINFVTGIRTINYNQFMEGVCKSVQPIYLNNHGNWVYCNIVTSDGNYIHNDYQHIKWHKGHFRIRLLDDLCKNDGLTCNEFLKWFIPKKDDKFEGKIIHWTDFQY